MQWNHLCASRSRKFRRPSATRVFVYAFGCKGTLLYIHQVGREKTCSWSAPISPGLSTGVGSGREREANSGSLRSHVLARDRRMRREEGAPRNTDTVSMTLDDIQEPSFREFGSGARLCVLLHPYLDAKRLFAKRGVGR